jgi:hypothetical protein
MSKIYRGDRTIDGVAVTVDGQPLPYRTDLKRIVEDFEWSYEGDAPNQLALALLADHLGDQPALALHDAFMRTVVANFSNEWEMTSEDLDTALRTITDRAA